MNLPVIFKHGTIQHVDIYHYPDGQKNIKLDLEYFNDPKQFIDIKCSIRNFSELEILIALVVAFRKYDFFINKIDFVYLFGMRSDRAFAPGMPNYFRNVVAPIINSLNPNHFRVLAPHSELSRKCIKAEPYVQHPRYEGSFSIGADASSNCDYSGWNRMIAHFDKKRNLAGEVDIHLQKEFYSMIEDSPEHFPILVWDDLCDGGATFIAIADYLKKHFPDRKRYLFITHGLFTKGIEHVSVHYNKVITTNSYQEFDKSAIPNNIEIIDVWEK